MALLIGCLEVQPSPKPPPWFPISRCTYWLRADQSAAFWFFLSLSVNPRENGAVFFLCQQECVLLRICVSDSTFGHLGFWFCLPCLVVNASDQGRKNAPSHYFHTSYLVFSSWTASVCYSLMCKERKTNAETRSNHLTDVWPCHHPAHKSTHFSISSRFRLFIYLSPIAMTAIPVCGDLPHSEQLCLQYRSNVNISETTILAVS